MNFTKCRIILLIAAFFSVADAGEGWKTICGEMSILSQIQNGINRNNVNAVFCYNSLTGEVKYLKSEIIEKRIAKASWFIIREAEETNGSYEVIFAEHTLISGVSTNDVDGESLYGPFLLNKKTGETFRLLTTIANGKITMKWVALPKPSKSTQGEWEISGYENTISQYQSSKRQNIYSLFLIDNATSEAYRIDSYYKKHEGIISDTLLPIESGKITNK